MKIESYKELIPLLLEFIISVIVIVGGGFLLVYNVAPEFAIASITTIIMFWFNQRDKEKQQLRTLEQLKNSPPVVVEPIVKDTTPKASA